MDKLPTPEEIQHLTKIQLVILHEKAKQDLDLMTKWQSTIRDMLYKKIELNGEVILGMQVTKAERITVKTTVEEAENFGAVLDEVDPDKISLNQARELGATKKSVNIALVRRMVRQGAMIPGVEKTGYLIIKPVEAENDKT